MRQNIDLETSIDHKHPSHVPKPNMNPSPLTVHEGADTTLIMGETAQPRGFVGHQRIPEEGYHRAPGGPTRDIFKVGDGKVDMGEGIITVNKAGGGQEKKPLKTGPKGGKYYEDTSGRKIYVGQASGQRGPGYEQAAESARSALDVGDPNAAFGGTPSEEEPETVDTQDTKNLAQKYVENIYEGYKEMKEEDPEQMAGVSFAQFATGGFASNESAIEEWVEDKYGPMVAGRLAGSVKDELYDAVERFEEPTGAPSKPDEGPIDWEAADEEAESEEAEAADDAAWATEEGGEPAEPTGDWSDKYGDIVASHRMALTPPEDVAVENYIASLDEAPSPGDKQESYMNFSQSLQDEGWDTVESFELATKLYRAHMDQGTKSEDDPPEDDDDVKKALVLKTIDEMVEAGEIDAKDREKVLPAVLARLLPAVAGGAAAKLTEDEEEEKGPKEVLERVAGVQEELPATVARQVSTRVDEQSGEAAADTAAEAAALIASRGRGKDKMAMQEMHAGVRKHGRVTFRKMCEDRAKTLTNILEKSDIAALNVMKEMGVDENSLSDEIAKAEYMVEVLHGN